METGVQIYGGQRRAWGASGSWGGGEMLEALCGMCRPGTGQERQSVHVSGQGQQALRYNVCPGVSSTVSYFWLCCSPLSAAW